MIKRSKEEWLSLFQQQVESGLSAAEFCRQNHLCSKHFCVRKKQLAKTVSPSKALVPVVVRAKASCHVEKLNVEKTLMQCRMGQCLLQFESLPEVTWLAQLMKAVA